MKYLVIVWDNLLKKWEIVWWSTNRKETKLEYEKTTDKHPEVQLLSVKCLKEHKP